MKENGERENRKMGAYLLLGIRHRLPLRSVLFCAGDDSVLPFRFITDHEGLYRLLSTESEKGIDRPPVLPRKSELPRFMRTRRSAWRASTLPVHGKEDFGIGVLEVLFLGFDILGLRLVRALDVWLRG